MCTKRNVVSAILAVGVLLAAANVTEAATEEQIETAIDNGVAWLVANQNPDGSWGGGDTVARTGFAVVKLQDRAREVPTNEYDDEIQDGLDYIFGQATIDPYDPGDSGICFAHGGHETYNTGIAMMAIANDGDLSQVVSGGVLNGKTYEEVLEGNVLFFAYSQNPDGGWRYVAGQEPSDQSNSGYAALGLGYANGVGIDTSAVNAGLINWINAIQNKTSGDPYEGGSEYTIGGGWENQLKTGNLIFRMTLVGIGPGDSRFDAAIAFIEKYWQDTGTGIYATGWGYNNSPAAYQAMYCLMKGLEYSGVDLIDTDGDSVPEDWHNQQPPISPAQDLASVIVAQQNLGGFWPAVNWGDSHLSTCWALLTLEKIVPNLPPVADAGDDQTVEQTSLDGAKVTLDGSGSTDDGLIEPLTYDWKWDGGSAIGPTPAPVTFPLGKTTVTLTVYDGEFTDTDTVVIKVEDTTPPVVACSVDTKMLWPPNHNLVNVGLDTSATDICDSDPLIDVLVFADEDDEEPTGDGNHSPDAKYDGETLRLRSERKGDSDGRVYLIVVIATDASGNEAFDCCTVVVPHSKSKKDIADVDAQALAAELYCLANGEEPPGFVEVGDGAVIGPKQ